MAAFFLHSRLAGWVCLWGGTLGLVLGYFGWFLAPLDVLAHLRTHFFGISLAGAIGLALSRFSQILTVVFVGGVFIAHASASWLQQDRARDLVRHGSGISVSEAVAADLQIVSLLTYNTWHRNHDHQSLAHFVLREDADLVVLTEFGPNKRHLLGMWKSRYPYQAHCSHVWQCSVVILSKQPFTAQKIVMREETRSPLVMIRFGDGATSTTIAATHLYRPIDGAARQMSEIATLNEELARIQGSLVLAGDFNATRFSYAYRSLTEAARLRSATVFAPTWPRWLPQLAIDHIFVRGDVRALDVAIASSGASDHLALRSRLLLGTGLAGRGTQRAKREAGRSIQ